MKAITRIHNLTKEASLIIVVIGIFCFTAIPTKAQLPAVVDSLSHTYNNGTSSVYLRLFRTAGFKIDSIQTQVLNDTLKMDVCVRNYITASVETHDTTVQVAILNNQAPNHLVLNLYDNDTSKCFNSPPYGTSNYVLGVNELNANPNWIKIFPNPSTGVLNLQLKNNLKILEIALYSLLGKKVKTYNATEKELNIEDMQSGLYFLKIQTDKGIIAKKIQIE